MTLIVGLKHGNGVYIAADSISANPSSGNCSVDPGNKVFRVGPFIFGCTSSFRLVQILRHDLPDWLKLVPREDPVRDLAYVLAHECRRALEHEKWVKEENKRQEGGEFLVGYRDELIQFQADFSYCLQQDYECIGAGAHYALGALHATKGAAARRRLLLAMEAAAEHNTFVRPPFVYLRSGPRPSTELQWLMPGGAAALRRGSGSSRGAK